MNFFLPRHLSASLSDWGDNVTLPPWGDPEIIVGGDPNFDKEKAIFHFFFFFSTIGSNKLNKEIKLL